jgi:hypothetical protein
MAEEEGTKIVPTRRSMSNWHLWIAVAAMLLTAACGGGKDARTDLREFYYPIRELRTGMAYLYEPVERPDLGRETWVLTSDSLPTGWELTTRIYDASQTLVQEVVEREVPNGTLALRLSFFTRDTADNVLSLPLRIEEHNLFPYEVSDAAQRYPFRVSYTEPGDSSLVTTLTRLRRFRGIDRVTLPDGDHPAALFSLTEQMDNSGEGTLTLEFSGEELYARGIGLAAWMKVRAPGDTLVYRLQRRMPLPDYERQFGKLP